LLWPRGYHEYQQPLSHALESLRDSIYRVVGLHQEEMHDARIVRVLDALSSRFGSRLNLDREAIDAAHRQTVRAVLKQSGPMSQAL
jgi:hypothetical protein